MTKSATELQPPPGYRSHFAYELGFDPMTPDEERIWKRQQRIDKRKKKAIEHIPDACWSELLTRTRVAAKKKRRDCDLTLNHIRDLAASTNGCCAVTGKQFTLTSIEGAYRRPFAPSIDRIDCSKGYVIGNVRLVCVAVNIGLSDWGEGVMYELARAMVDKYAGQAPPTIRVDQEYKPNAVKGRSEKWIADYMTRHSTPML